jgi:hypothetical protein
MLTPPSTVSRGTIILLALATYFWRDTCCLVARMVLSAVGTHPGLGTDGHWLRFAVFLTLTPVSVRVALGYGMDAIRGGL